MKKYLVVVLFTIWSFSMLKAQNPNVDSDLVWKYYPEGDVSQLKLTADNSALVFGKVGDTMFYYLNTDTKFLNKSIRVKHGLDANSIAFSESLLAIGGNYNTNAKENIFVDIYNSQTGEYVYSLTDDSLVYTKYLSIVNISVSKDNKYLLANIERSDLNPESKYGGSLFLWDLETKKVVRTFRYNIGYKGGIIDNQNRYIVARYNGHIAVIDFNTFKIVKEMPQDVRGFDFSPDGKYLATCGVDGYINIWNVNSGFTLFKDMYYTRAKALWYIKFTPDSKYLVSGGGGDCFTTIWQVEAGKLLKEYGDISGGATGVSISNDMKYIYSSSASIKKFNFNVPTSINTEPQVTRIFPNPTNGFVTINTNCISPQMQCSITNQLGQVLYSNIVQNINNQIKLNFSQYPNGIYNIMLHCNQNISNYKIIKE